MSVRDDIGAEVLGFMSKSVTKEIARHLVEQAMAGDLEAVRAVLGFAAAAEANSPEHCEHPEGKRRPVGPQTMGGTSLQERCACGVMLVDGKPVEED